MQGAGGRRRRGEGADLDQADDVETVTAQSRVQADGADPDQADGRRRSGSGGRTSQIR
jgi:hypothetical protein